MSRPIFKINGHDYTRYLAEDGLKPTRNDLDSDGSGRNLLDGLMYRSRIATKVKWTVAGGGSPFFSNGHCAADCRSGTRLFAHTPGKNQVI